MTAHSLLDVEFDPRRPARTAARIYRGQRRNLGLAALAFTAKHSPVWVMPLLTANVIDAVVEQRPVSVIWLNGAIMTVLVLCNLPLTWAYARWLSLAIRTVEVGCRAVLCERLQRLSIGYHRRMSAGVLQAKVIRDVETVVDTSRQVFDSGMGAVSTLAGALVLTAVRVPSFLPVFAVTVPAGAALVWSMRKRMREHNTAFRRQIETLSSRVSEMTHLIPVTRAHALERDELDRIDVTLHDVRREGVRLDVLNGRFNAAAWVLFQLLSVGCLILAAWASSTGALAITPGDVVLLSTYFVALTSSVTTLLNVAPFVNKGIESVRSMSEVLTEPDLERNEGRRPVPSVDGRVRFEHVTVVYDGAGQPALDDVELEVAPGETVAIVGASGSGKSTLLSLVIGFVEPTSGRVLLDGRDARELDLRQFRRHLAVVPQESLLFDATVRDNVAYGRPDAGDAAVHRALRAANAAEFVAELGGLDAVVGQRGARLSGGQRQRLAIARALLRDPRVLVLDEATSALDTGSEQLVQQALANLVRDRTTFVVAHRLSTVRGADRIVVLEHGHVVEIGSHEQLLERGGAYVRLHDLSRS